MGAKPADVLVEGPALTAGRLGRPVGRWPLETATGRGTWVETGLYTPMGTADSTLEVLGAAG